MTEAAPLALAAAWLTESWCVVELPSVLLCLLALTLTAQLAGALFRLAITRLETGQARPSRDLVLRLAISLDLDMPEAKALLRASGHLGILGSSRHSARHAVHASPDGSPFFPPSP